MVSLVLILKRFWRVARGGWSDPEFRGLGLIIAGWLALGTIIYSANEGWSVVESFYFCVMTLTTIGYGDFSPTTAAMQLYTVVYAVLGIGFFVAFTTKLVQVAFVQERHADADEGGESEG